MILIFTPNTESPYNLIQITPNWGLLPEYDNDESKVIDYVIERNKSSGQIAEGATYWLIDSEKVPTDHYFFEAWEYGDDSVIVNMSKARNIHMNAIRVERNKELTAKDITFMRSVEDGNTDAQATIKAEKQALRDLPTTFDITTDVDTPEQLKVKWPTELPARE
jgi:hypothetical protein